MKKRILLPTLIIGTLLTGSLALASPGFGGNCGRGGDGCTSGGCNSKAQGNMTYEQHEERTDRRLEMMSTVLDLTEAQQEQIDSLFKQRWQDNQQLREQMQSSRDSMRKVQSADSFNEADFRAEAAKRAELKTEMMVRKIKFQDELYALLTPEQREKADKLDGIMMMGKGKRHGGKGMHF